MKLLNLFFIFCTLNFTLYAQDTLDYQAGDDWLSDISNIESEHRNYGDTTYSQECYYFNNQKVVVHQFKPAKMRTSYWDIPKSKQFRKVMYIDDNYDLSSQQKEFYKAYFSLSVPERLHNFILGLKNNSTDFLNKYKTKLAIPKNNELGYVPLLCVYDFEGLTEIKEGCIDGGLAGYYVYNYEKLSEDSASWADCIAGNKHRDLVPLDSIDLPSKYADYTILMTYFKKNMNDRAQYAIMIDELQLFKDAFFYEVIFNDIKALLGIRTEDKQKMWKIIHRFVRKIKHSNKVDFNTCEKLTKEKAQKVLIKYD